MGRLFVPGLLGLSGACQEFLEWDRAQLGPQPAWRAKIGNPTFGRNAGAGEGSTTRASPRRSPSRAIAVSYYRRSDDFLCDSDTYEGFYNLGEQGRHVIGDAPRSPTGAPGRRGASHSVASRDLGPWGTLMTLPTWLSAIVVALRNAGAHYVDDAQTGFTFVDVPLHNAQDSPLDERGEVGVRKPMAPTPNLKSMSVERLSKLKDQIDAALATKVADERRALQAQLGELAHFAGGRMRFKGSAGRGVVPPKYRNPDNPAETWAGRGLKPRWLAAALKSGKKLEQFVIAGPARAASARKMPKRTRKAVKK
jgi:DNA-binding protein H-NS